VGGGTWAGGLGLIRDALDGRSRALFRRAERDACRIFPSGHAVEEARRNLRHKASERAGELESLLELVHLVSEADPRIVEWAADLGLPCGDAPILGAAVASRSDLLVTGDRRHFARLFGPRHGGVLVVPPSDALEAVLDELGI
jgi:hypothetical protein